MLQILSLTGLVIVSMLLGVAYGLRDKPETKCNKVMAYIPVKSKWIIKEVCLEGEK